jgi:hypothetical protein
MKTIKVAEATKAQLDWLVAKCEGYKPDAYMRSADIRKDAAGKVIGVTVPARGERHYDWFCPTTDWSQMGPIIEREKIGLSQFTRESGELVWVASAFSIKRWGYGLTPLIAAARCYVISKLGDEVEVPNALA